MDKEKADMVGFFSLEQFVDEVRPVTNKVRVEAISKTVPSGSQIGPLKEWWVVVTAMVDGYVALFSILVSEVWAVFAEREPYHADNADLAHGLVKRYLERQGFVVRPGIWNPRDALDNFVRGSAGLWRFDEDRRLVEIASSLRSSQ